MTATHKFRLLIVEDDPLVSEAIKLCLPTHWTATAVTDGRNLSGKMHFHAAFVDLHLQASGPAQGPDIIALLQAENPRTELIAISGDLSPELMEKCLHKGAKRFLAKPLVLPEVQSVLEKIEALWMMRQIELNTERKSVQLVGDSAPIEKLRDQIANLRGETGPILIEGETGTGKEVVANLINQQESDRCLVSINAAGIPDSLFESELFGHTKGAFTGADQIKIGLVEAASGGDLFIDEVEALSLTAQAKLLRFLETGEFRKLGAKQSQVVHVRCLFASNRNLSDMVKNGEFREDLLFRMMGKTLRLPALRAHKSDIDALSSEFLGRLKPRTNKMFSPEALEVLKRHEWPGNVRELKRVCEHLAFTCPLPIIRETDVNQWLNQNQVWASRHRTKIWIYKWV